MALTKNNPDQVFAYRWKEIVRDIDEDKFNPEVLENFLTEKEYSLLLDIAKKL